eukprot:5535615-Prymnesium_polylepis.2
MNLCGCSCRSRHRQTVVANGKTANGAEGQEGAPCGGVRQGAAGRAHRVQDEAELLEDLPLGADEAILARRIRVRVHVERRGRRARALLLEVRRAHRWRCPEAARTLALSRAHARTHAAPARSRQASRGLRAWGAIGAEGPPAAGASADYRERWLARASTRRPYADWTAGATHPHVELLQRSLRVEPVEHDLRGGDGDLRQTQQDATLLDALAAEDELAGVDVVGRLRHRRVSSEAERLRLAAAAEQMASAHACEKGRNRAHITHTHRRLPQPC